MRRTPFLILAVAVAIALYAGCSDESLVGSGSGRSIVDLPSGMPFSIVGPSEIAICIDVSDSISADELSAVVGGLKGALSDPSTIPQDGSVTISAVVYGDTIAVSFDPTPVTSDNLLNVIVPALDSLLVDRPVGDSTAVMRDALLYAGSVLDVSAAQDRQILIIGSGTAFDPAGVESACQELLQLGIMVSTVGIDPDEAGSALLESCSSTTGGLFGAGSSGFDALIDQALIWMLYVDLDAEPEQLELLRGEEHTVNARAFRGMDPENYPLAGLEVTFEILSGPNMAETLSDTTDSSGMAEFMFTGDGGPGTDIVLASSMHPGTGTLMGDTVTVTWINTPPVCDAGGPYEMVAVSDTAEVELDATASSDADGDTLMFAWSIDSDCAFLDDPSSATPVLTIVGDCLCVDSVMVELMVSDGFDSSACHAVVQIDDLRPPVIEAGEPYMVWPPNHKYVKITPDMLIESAEDACGRPIDVNTASVVEVRSDEPEDHKGDGRTIKDIRVMCPNRLMLRAERMGGGNGRVYTVVFSITAENGVSAETEAKVFVPHDMSDPTAMEDYEGGYTFIPECGERR